MRVNTKIKNLLISKKAGMLLLFLLSTLGVLQAQTTTIELEILPTGSTSSLGEVHTMTSAVTAHPAGGTFTVSFDVDPGDDRRVSVNGSSPLIWATNATSRFFLGSNGDKTQNVSNLQVTIVDDNGGTLTTAAFSDLEFTGASIGNAKNDADGGFFTYNGDSTQFTFGPDIIQGEPWPFPFPSSTVVTSFNTGVTNSEGLNKWGIAGVKVSVTYQNTLSVNHVDGFAEKGYKLYPNPASSILFVKSESGANIAVYNAVGVEVLKISNATITQEINTGALAKGVYFIKVNNSGSKFIIK